MIAQIINRLRRICLTTAFLTAASMLAGAQITYSRAGLGLNGDYRSGRKGITINNVDGSRWTFEKSTKFLQLSFLNNATCLAGSQNRIVFYNTDIRTFNILELSDVYQHSDARAKTNIKNMNSALNTILGLRPVSFIWKNTADTPQTNEPKTTQYGFLAQDVSKIIPDVVITSDTGELLVNYTAIIPMLVQSIRELQTDIAQRGVIIERLSKQLESVTASQHTEQK